MELPLDSEAITGTASRLDLATLEAMMVWPDDPSARDAWLKAVRLEEGLERLDEMPEELLRVWARDAYDGPRIVDMQPDLQRRFPYGQIAGSIVAHATTLSVIAPDESALGQVKKRIAKALKGTFQIEPQTMNNKTGPVHRFRPVAHLWAAYMVRGGDAFPCTTSALSEFLAHAEAVRELAEESRAPRSKSTMMRPGEAVTLPAGVLEALPKVELTGTATSPDLAP